VYVNYSSMLSMVIHWAYYKFYLLLQNIARHQPDAVK